MPPNRFESEVESFLEGSHGDRTHHKQRADHHTVTPLCGTLLEKVRPAWSDGGCEREKVRPAYEKWPKIGGLWRAGRVSSHQPVLCQGLVDNAAHFRLAVVGVLQH